LVVWLLFSVGSAHAAFDEPSKTIVVQVARAPVRTSVTVSCFYYATFMVKVIVMPTDDVVGITQNSKV
jgi:hypothetical protein